MVYEEKRKLPYKFKVLVETPGKNSCEVSYIKFYLASKQIWRLIKIKTEKFPAANHEDDDFISPHGYDT